MKRHAEIVDFEKLYLRLKAQITALEVYAEQLKNKKNKDNIDKFISDLSLPDIENEIDIKEKLLKEYLIRSEEWNLKKKQEFSEYKKNYKNLIRIAKNYKTNLRVPTEIRNHLKEVLSFDYQNLKTNDEKIAFYLSLKKEVEMCRKSVKNKIK